MAVGSVTFTKGVEALTLPAPDAGSNNKPRRRQLYAGAVGGHLITSNVDGGQGLRATNLFYAALPDSDYVAMATFLETHANLGGLSFSIDDWDGFIYTVKYFGGLYDFSPIRGGENQTGTLRLLEVP